MKLHIMSDLHFEFHHDYGHSIIKNYMKPQDKNEVLVLAGDIFNLKHRRFDENVTALNQITDAGYNAVLYVPGNHEFWGAPQLEIEQSLLALESMFSQNFYVMKTGHIVEIDGQRFIGDTMWFGDDGSNWRYDRGWSDFRTQGLKEYAYTQNKKFMEFLDDELKEGDVVITHHLPSEGSVHPRYKGDPTNRFFVSPCDNQILNRKPKVWLHGHTHEKFDYVLGQTRVVSNPLGYPYEDTELPFESRKIVEV
jgi:predicted phosphodiesterase